MTAVIGKLARVVHALIKSGDSREFNGHFATHISDSVILLRLQGWAHFLMQFAWRLLLQRLNFLVLD